MYEILGSIHGKNQPTTTTTTTTKSVQKPGAWVLTQELEVYLRT